MIQWTASQLCLSGRVCLNWCLPKLKHYQQQNDVKVDEYSVEGKKDLRVGGGQDCRGMHVTRIYSLLIYS